MDLTAAEARVLGCLIERQVTEPDEYALSLDELRFACNQTSGRHPVVAFDDRAVEDALLSLKAMGLARFVVAGRTTGPVHYRHRADERWRLSRPELAALAVLLLRGPLTLREVRATLADSPIAVDEPFDVEAALDALAGRTPTPLAARLPGNAARGEQRWTEALTAEGRRSRSGIDALTATTAAGGTTDTGAGEPSWASTPGVTDADPSRRPGRGAATAEPLPWTPPTHAPARPSPTLADLADRLTNIERRLAGIEAALGALRAAATAKPPGPPGAPTVPPTRAHR